jgi:uncharacterized phosphatase
MVLMEPNTTCLALVRHGQTDWNLYDLLQGSSDIPLNDTGRAQAREAARLLSDAHWDRIVTSPLVRAVETARIIAGECGIRDVELDGALVERDYGDAEGITREEATARWGQDWPGEESYADLTIRAVLAVDAVAQRYPGENLILATHGTFIRAFTDAVVGAATIKPDNAHSVRFRGAPGAWQVTAGLNLL